MDCLKNKNSKIAVWTSACGNWSTEADNDALLAWIKEGNGFIHALNPEKWHKVYVYPFYVI